MSKWTAEEVRAMSEKLSADVPRFNTEDERLRCVGMLTHLANRIEADESAVPVAFRFLGPDGEAVTEWEDAPITSKKFPDLCPPIESVQYAYLHPPAQAAQGEDWRIDFANGSRVAVFEYPPRAMFDAVGATITPLFTRAIGNTSDNE